ncbi:MAG: hypothetical protein WCP22_10195 [Chlamydiota bacterium]
MAARTAPHPCLSALCACALCLILRPAHGADIVVDRVTAAALAGFEGAVPNFLRSHPEYFREGLDAAPATAFSYAGIAGVDAAATAAGALAAQIALARALFPSERSPYMAYRLGVLTRTLIEMSFPLPAWAPPDAAGIRERFLRDIEAHPADLDAPPAASRVLANPASALKSALDRSSGWAGPVRAQYLAGRGYNTITRQAAAGSAQAAASLVRNALATVGAERKAQVSPKSLDDFYRDACGFYLRRGMQPEAAAAYRLIAGETGPPQIDTIETALERYAIVRDLEALDKEMRAAGVEIPSPAGGKQKALFLTALSAFAQRCVDSGLKDSARTALAILLREGYQPDRTTGAIGALYGLNELRDMDVPENAWRVYREANRLEASAGKARLEGKPFAANDALMRAAALYAAVPEGAGGLRKSSQARIAQVAGAMRDIPPDALASEELFRAAVGSIAAGDIEAATRSLSLSERRAPGDRAVREAAQEAEAIRLFAKGKELYEVEEYDKAVKQFRMVVEKHPRSALAGEAGKMLDLYAQRKAQQRGALLLLLRGAYEASFVGDEATVYARCDELLAAKPDDDLRDRAQLLIALAWYETSQRGYQKIDRIFRDLLKNEVLDVDGPDLVLRKRIDFYFGLKDTFPGMEIARLRGSLAEKLDLAAVRGGEGGGGGAEDTLKNARDEIDAVTELIDRGEGEKIDMRDARALLDRATDLADDAAGLIESGTLDDAEKKARDALGKAEDAREEAEKLLGVAGGQRENAQKEIDDADSAVRDAEDAVEETEDKLDQEFDDLRTALDEAKDLLKEANDRFERAEYDEAKDKASETIDKAKEVKDDSEEQLKEGEEAAEQAEEDWVVEE